MAVKTVPILVFLKTFIKTEAMKIRIIVLPIPSKECPKFSQKS